MMKTSRRLFPFVLVIVASAMTAALAFADSRATEVTGSPAAAQAGPAGMSLIYRFSGVTDDGAKGASTRKEATTVLCTNFGTTTNQVEVQLFQWNGALVYTATVNMNPDATFAFSTQNTTIYFDDVIFGSGGGTDAIFQGSGQVWAGNRRVICSVQALDPLGYPPVFATRLPLYDGAGRLVNRQMPDPDINLPVIVR